jgi:hypothetical protein
VNTHLNLHRTLARLVLLVAVFGCAGQAAAAAPDGRIRLPDLSALEAKASETAEVTLDERLLGLAARLLDPSNPEEARARAAVNGLKAITVRSYTFDTATIVPQKDLDAIRTQLESPGWNHIVSTHNRREASHVDVYLAVEGNSARGLVLLATEPKQFTVVNLVGAVDLDKLRRLEGQLGVPKVDLDSGGKPASAR